MKTNVIVVGPQKCGTSSIYEYFKRRGDVQVPSRVKEPMFFDRNFDKGLDWYDGHFSENCVSDIRVEVSPTYFNDINAQKNIANYNPNTRVIIILRDPCEKLYSQWLHDRKYGFIDSSKTFIEAINSDKRLLDSVAYCRHIKNWYDAIGEDKVHVLWFDNFKKDPKNFENELSLITGLCRRFDAFPKEKVNELTVPRNYMVAKKTQVIADVLRSYGLYKIINLLKFIGLKKLIFTGGKIPPKMTFEERAYCEEKTKLEMQELKHLLGLSILPWEYTCVE